MSLQTAVSKISLATLQSEYRAQRQTFSLNQQVALFWKASKFNLHSVGKKPPNRWRIAQEKEQQPQHLLKWQKIEETKCAERKQELQVLYRAEQSLKNQKIVGQTDGKFPLAFSAVDQNSGEVKSKVNKYHVISWNHRMKAGYSSTLFATNQPEVTELHGRTTGWNSWLSIAGQAKWLELIILALKSMKL